MSFIKVFHGSDTLKAGLVPDASMGSAAYFSLDKKFAMNFGRQCYCFRIPESLIMDLRKPEVIDRIKSHPQGNDLLRSVLPSGCVLPHAYGSYHLDNDLNLVSLSTLRKLALELGYKASLLMESDWKDAPFSIEVYDSSIIEVVTED